MNDWKQWNLICHEEKSIKILLMFLGDSIRMENQRQSFSHLEDLQPVSNRDPHAGGIEWRFNWNQLLNDKLDGIGRVVYP